jgi:hypothetical protein
VIAHLSADFAAIAQQLARMSADLTELDRQLSGQPLVEPVAFVPPAAEVAPPVEQPATPSAELEKPAAAAPATTDATVTALDVTRKRP